MRRLRERAMRLLVLGALAAFAVAAQQPANQPADSAASNSTPAATPAEQGQPRQYSIWWPLVPDPLPPLEPPPPEVVRLERGTQLSVILDTPLSTRMTKTGERVTFLLSQPLELGDGLELPPDTRILGTVTEARRPGTFGRPGKLKVKIEKIELATGGEARLAAKLQSGDPSATRLQADSNRATDLYNLATWSLQGTLIGASLGGGKGAGIGAGAGAAAAILIMASRRGPDLYLEPGMPFIVTLDSPAELRGWDVRHAQRQFASTGGNGADGPGETASDSNPENDSELRGNRPKLKRRPKNP